MFKNKCNSHIFRTLYFMSMYDLIVVGGGLSGMTAALIAAQNGIKKIMIIEREECLGGVLNQCICNGFGKKLLDMELTGTEYVNFIEERLKEFAVEYKLNTEVLQIEENKSVKYVNPKEGVVHLSGKAIMLSTGCREKFTGSITIPVNSAIGVYSVGSVQKIVNIEGYLPGKYPVIVAENNWALMIARRLVIEGAEVKALIIDEKNGFKLNKNNLKIIEGFDIKVIENTYVEEVYGSERIEGVKVHMKNQDKHTLIACDSLILSVGYFPEVSTISKTTMEMDEKTLAPKVNDYKTSIDGIFSCGNVIYGLNALTDTEVNGVEAGKKVVEYLIR